MFFGTQCRYQPLLPWVSAHSGVSVSGISVQIAGYCWSHKKLCLQRHSLWRILRLGVGSRDVIGHVIIRFPTGHFLLMVCWNEASIVYLFNLLVFIYFYFTVYFSEI